MNRVLLASSLLAAACAGSDGKLNQPDAHVGDTDASGGCAVTLSYTPAMPEADAFATIRVIADAHGGGVVSYNWQVFFQNTPVSFTYAWPDQSRIDFIAPVPGSYRVTVGVNNGCFAGSTMFDVAQHGANVTDYRMRVTPPPSFAPPQDTIVQVHGGADFTRDIALDPGLSASGTVRNGTTAVPAYLRFMPVVSPTAIVETFTQLDGSFSVRVLSQTNEVLVVPAVPGLAPRKAIWMPGTTTFAVDPGTAVSGVVRDPANTPLAGAKVELSINGVPSTLATTAADGSFTVRVAQLASPSTIDVTPPPGRGLARLHATSSFDLTQSVQVRFTGTSCDLANTTVKRAAANLPGAKVTVVGTLAAAGTIVTGTTTMIATGDVRIATAADGSGRLPSVLVPRAALSAVVEIAPQDLAVAPIDVTTCPSVAISAPPFVTVSGTVQDPQLAALAGVELEATPAGDLALAGTQPIAARSTVGGAFAIALASGGRYDVRFTDPFGRGAPFVALDILASNVPATVTLPRALHVKGSISVPGNSNPVIGAAVQVLCLQCSGVAATRPIGATASDSASGYRIAIPDPGTM